MTQMGHEYMPRGAGEYSCIKSLVVACGMCMCHVRRDVAVTLAWRLLRLLFGLGAWDASCYDET